ncbi:asparagine synthase (glutamine-hydrolyzing) [Terasakiella pusilla]|uniref:asparagine synthase (glutamine-hydrolyzing) n=1 Tax=Terasakiella pusilla TaxID=64973 RepID=UPI000490116D|nr:asparagine synthase (glutamine-hydrolyzing) [Terasakiella pusilla]
MCGIVGSFAIENGPLVEEQCLIAMRDAMIHRGPDGAGIWLSDDRKIGLGHRRLSILDLSQSASQPMVSTDNRFVLTFNGEIYNHVEIREELKQKGVTDWVTDHSDTEVLLNAYRVWGLDAVAKFRGMFAFAIWDNQERTLTMVRDRIGIKPLYWTKRKGRFSFASEIKGLLEDPAQPRKMDEEALFHYLALMSTPAPMTMFEGIKKMEPGCWMTIDEQGQISGGRYWDIWDEVNPMTNMSEDDIASRILADLETAVTYRKVGDVPVGVFLSGGIDSSTNAALFTKGESQPIKTFSIGYSEDYGSYKNELHHARLVAEKLGAEHHELTLTQDDLTSFVPQLVHLQDEPIADPVCVPVYYVSKLARDNGVTVCQVGEGADEVYWGYPWWKVLMSVNEKLTWPIPRTAYKLGYHMLGAMGTFKEHKVRDLIRRKAMNEPFFFSGAETFTYNARESLLSPRLREKFKGQSTADALSGIVNRYKKGVQEDTPLNWMSYVDLNLRLPELLLMRVDKMSMGVSLECRVPFLDHKFVGMGMSIPTEVKMRNGTLKHILKKAVRGTIPDQIIDRPKQGFGVPIHEWFQDKLGEHMKQEIYEFCALTDVFDLNYVNAMFQQKDGVRLWWLFNLAAWHKHFIRKESFSF